MSFLQPAVEVAAVEQIDPGPRTRVADWASGGTRWGRSSGGGLRSHSQLFTEQSTVTSHDLNLTWKQFDFDSGVRALSKRELVGVELQFACLHVQGLVTRLDVNLLRLAFDFVAGAADRHFD